MKDRVGGDVVEFSVIERSRLADAAVAVSDVTEAGVETDDEAGRVMLRVGSQGSQALIRTVRALDQASIETDGLGLRRPSLDDVFLALTGHATEETAADGGAPKRGRGGGRTKRAKASAGAQEQ
ncbi:MAG: hypothetical protein M3Y36_03210 [Actinomycetota bacterium]|nr:hypothetical protein [Actinomycetota bacterium]